MVEEPPRQTSSRGGWVESPWKPASKHDPAVVGRLVDAVRAHLDDLRRRLDGVMWDAPPASRAQLETASWPWSLILAVAAERGARSAEPTESSMSSSARVGHGGDVVGEPQQVVDVSPIAESAPTTRWPSSRAATSRRSRPPSASRGPRRSCRRGTSSRPSAGRPGAAPQPGTAPNSVAVTETCRRAVRAETSGMSRRHGRRLPQRSVDQIEHREPARRPREPGEGSRRLVARPSLAARLISASGGLRGGERIGARAGAGRRRRRSVVRCGRFARRRP